MLAKVVLDVAPESFDFAPILLVLLLAPIALVTTILLLRYRRKGSE